VTLSKDPVAEDMVRGDTWAAKSLPLPTILGRGPLAGGCGFVGAVVHGTSRHSGLGYDDVKHPVFGNGVRDMVARQASRLCAADLTPEMQQSSFIAAGTSDFNQQLAFLSWVYAMQFGSASQACLHRAESVSGKLL
jgi:hypothetical protein